MTRRKQRPLGYVNHRVTDLAGRVYRVCLSASGRVMAVARKTKRGETAIDPTGPKGRALADEVKSRATRAPAP